MSQDFKEQVLAAVPIEAYIGRVTSLKKKGRYHSGLCPFHKEKTPSFTVTPEKGLYHCFGCGKGGDLFRFVMDYENVSFPEALDILARFAGIEKPRVRNSPGQDRREKLYELNAEVMRRFQDALRAPGGNEVRRYLDERGLTSESIETFAIGYAPAERDFLLGPLSARQAELRELGLVKESEDGRSYEFFRERLIFPIRDVRGAVVAFGGRVLPTSNHPAKYLNSPDSAVFHKSSVLYGLYSSLPGIRERQECYLVEGYLDVIGLFQAGVKNAVAPMGTALTAEHLKLLRRYARRVVLLLDGDRAGRAAALKSARLIVDHGDMEADLILLSNGFDPFDVVKTATPGQFEKLRSARISAERFLLHEILYPDYFAEYQARAAENAPAEQDRAAALDNLLKAAEEQRAYYNGDRPDLYPTATERKKAALRNLFPFLSELSQAAAREFFLSDAARILSISVEALREEWRGNGQPATPGVPGPIPTSASRPVTAGARPGRSVPGDSAANPVLAALRRCEESLVLEFAYDPGLAANYLDIMQDFSFVDEGAAIFWRYMEDRIVRGDIWTGDTLDLSGLPEETMMQFNEGFTRKAEEVAFRAGLEDRDPASAVEELLRDHRIRSLQFDIARLEKERVVADPLDREALLKEMARLQKEIRQLRERQRHRHGAPESTSTAQHDQHKIGASGTLESS